MYKRRAFHLEHSAATVVKKGDDDSNFVDSGLPFIIDMNEDVAIMVTERGCAPV